MTNQKPDKGTTKGGRMAYASSHFHIDLPTSTPLTTNEELEELLYDVGLTFLPKDCAMVGDLLISPPRKKVMRENTGKDYAKAVKAVKAYIDQQTKEAYEKGKYDGAREWAEVQAIENSTMGKSCVMPCCLVLTSDKQEK